MKASEIGDGLVQDVTKEFMEIRHKHERDVTSDLFDILIDRLQLITRYERCVSLR